jgi:acetyltransferase-like isoleucine patch superfamily enzyme
MAELIRFLIFFPLNLFQMLMCHLPGQAGVLLRRYYYGRRFRKCGKDLWIGTGVQISSPSRIVVGDDVKIRENVIIHTGGGRRPDDRREFIELTSYQSHEKGLVTLGNHCRVAFGAVVLGYGGVRIGDNCGVGPGAIILSESFHHKGKDESRVYKYSQGALPEDQCVIQGLVTFCDGAGVASHVIVLPGATIGRDSWVAPKSVVRVRGRIEANVIAKGDPAVTIFKRPYAAKRKQNSRSGQS